MSVCLSVCLSVCVSVRRQNFVFWPIFGGLKLEGGKYFLVERCRKNLVSGGDEYGGMGCLIFRTKAKMSDFPHPVGP